MCIWVWRLFGFCEVVFTRTHFCRPGDCNDHISVRGIPSATVSVHLSQSRTGEVGESLPGAAGAVSKWIDAGCPMSCDYGLEMAKG